MFYLLLLVFVAFIIHEIATSTSSSRRRKRPSPRSSISSSPSGEASYRPGARAGRPEAPPRNMAEAAAESEACWVPPRKAVTVAGYDIPGGMLYVGRRLRSLRSWGAPDPALIDPSLRVNRGQPDRSGQFMSYWPSYSEMAPTSRAAYLEWLAGGRRDPSACIGYVFLFFYGIEHRILVDAQHSARAKEEIPVLLKEVEELLQVYGSNRSFRGYASNLLDFASLLSRPLDIAALEPPKEAVGWEYPLRLKLALAAMSKAGEPVPPAWALAWVRCAPDCSLRTPAQRCSEEFDQLFQLRYREKYGDGLRIKPNKTRLSASYRPASATFSHQVALDLPDLPDVTRLRAPLNRLQKLADAVCDELDGYSRWIGRNEDRTSPAALALLPPELVRSRMGSEAEALIRPIETAVRTNGITVVKTAQLVSRFPSRHERGLTKKEAGMLAGFLARLGYGIEPDVRYGGPNLSRSDCAAVFRLPGPDQAPSDAYHSATVLLRLGATVAAADDEITPEEEQRLEEHLEAVLHLGESDRVRLRAHLRWLIADPPNLNGVKRRIEELPQDVREGIGRFLITVAGADGHVTPDELRVLSKVYPLLGLDAESVYGDVHAMAASGFEAHRGPVTVLPADKVAGFPIPRPETAEETQTVVLDMAKVVAIKEETRQATEVLEKIFAGEEPAQEDEPLRAEDEEGDEPAVLVPGLDAKHSALLRVLAERHHWPRAEFEALTKQYGLLPAGAIEIINEALFEVCAEPVLEGIDPIEVNPYALEELLS